MGDLHAPILGSVVLSSATAWMVLHLLLGDEPLFHVAGLPSGAPGRAARLRRARRGRRPGLGRIRQAAAVAAARFQRLPASTTWLQPAVGGLTVGILGFFVPEVLGVGYDYVERVLNGDIVLGLDRRCWRC